MGEDKYTKFSHFKDRALEPAINEINNFSDKTITYNTIRKGRTIEYIVFTIGTKDITNRARINAEIEQRLNNNQLSLFDDIME